jgi:hypothetical protein
MMVFNLYKKLYKSLDKNKNFLYNSSTQTNWVLILI